MEGGALLSDWWSEVSNEFVPYLNITARLDDKPDQELFGAKGATGFPTCYFLDPETGAVLNDWFWPQDADTVREQMTAAKAKSTDLTRLRREAQASPADAALQATLALKLAMMYASEMGLDELAALARTDGLDAQLVTEFMPWLNGRRVQAVIGEANAAESRDEYERVVGEGFHALLEEGVTLPPDDDMARFYYSYAFEGSLTASHKACAQKAFDGYEAILKRLVVDNPDYKERAEKDLAQRRERIAELDKTAAGDD